MKYISILFLLLVVSCSVEQETGINSPLIIYSSRQNVLLEPVLDIYKKQTGKKVQMLYLKGVTMIERLKAERKNTQADLVIAVDLANIQKLANEGLLSSYKAKNFGSSVRNSKDVNDRWYGLSVRARTIVYNTKLVSENDLSTYSDLANAKWKDKLCLRTSTKSYSVSLLSEMLYQLDEKKLERVIKGWVRNLAAPVYSSDTELIKAVDSGLCQVAIVNHYYYHRLKKLYRNNTKLYWANQKQSGVHGNLTSVGLTAKGTNRKQAMELVEWLLDNTHLFAELNDEFVINRIPAASPKISLMPASVLLENQKQVSDLALENGYL